MFLQGLILNNNTVPMGDGRQVIAIATGTVTMAPTVTVVTAMDTVAASVVPAKKVSND